MYKQTKEQKIEGGRRRMIKGHKENARKKVATLRLREERKRHKRRPTK